jgi:hypothetical protein
MDHEPYKKEKWEEDKLLELEFYFSRVLVSYRVSEHREEYGGLYFEVELLGVVVSNDEKTRYIDILPVLGVDAVRDLKAQIVDLL